MTAVCHAHAACKGMQSVSGSASAGGAGHPHVAGHEAQWNSEAESGLRQGLACLVHVRSRVSVLCRPTKTMNPSLARFMLARTPEHILHPETMADKTFTLNTGAKIPAVGLGTWQSG